MTAIHWVALLSGVGLVFGVLYAIKIAVRPFKAESTWLEVVVGVAATLACTFLSQVAWLVMIFGLSMADAVFVALFPTWFIGITGGTMIVGQVVKNNQAIHSFGAYERLSEQKRLLEQLLKESQIDDSAPGGAGRGSGGVSADSGSGSQAA